MKAQTRINHEFVEYIPEILAEGTIYISIRFCVAVHLCCSGCGGKVVTPITPHDWQLTFDGENISLSPSIGNWSLPCQSHYWIKKNRILWTRKFSMDEIAKVRSPGAQWHQPTTDDGKSRDAKRKWFKRLHR